MDLTMSYLVISVQRYFMSIGQSSPLIGLEIDLMTRFNSCTRILLESMSALGHLFFEGNESSAYAEARRQCLALSVHEPNPEAQEVVDFITALILITYIEYGANNEEQASLCLTRAS